MKKNLMKVLAILMVLGSILTACGGAAKPSGTYSTYDLSFNLKAILSQKIGGILQTNKTKQR